MNHNQNELEIFVINMLEKLLEEDHIYSSTDTPEIYKDTTSSCIYFNENNTKNNLPNDILIPYSQSIFQESFIHSNCHFNQIKELNELIFISPVFSIKSNEISHDHKKEQVNYNIFPKNSCIIPECSREKTCRLNDMFNNFSFNFNTNITICEDSIDYFHSKEFSSLSKKHSIIYDHPSYKANNFQFYDSPLHNLQILDNSITCSEILSNKSKDTTNLYPKVNQNTMYVFKKSFRSYQFEETIKKITTLEIIGLDLYFHLKGNFFYTITTQHGSRVLQNSLQGTSQRILSLILDELKFRIFQLMVHPYGNYFCQKFFIYLSHRDKLIFLRNIKDNILYVANNKIGTYPLQELIRHLQKPEELNILINSVSQNCREMFYDSYGVHVVEKIITIFEERFIKNIYQEVLNNFLQLALDVNGLCLVTKIIIHASKERTRYSILRNILNNFSILVQHTYGNYTILTVLENWDNSIILPIFHKFLGKLYTLSTQKFSSNVVEKVLEKGGQIMLGIFINEIGINNKIAELMRSNYGNYVVQKVLSLATDTNRIKIIELIQRNIDGIGVQKLIDKWRYIMLSYVRKNDLRNFEIS